MKDLMNKEISMSINRFGAILGFAIACLTLMGTLAQVFYVQPFRLTEVERRVNTLEGIATSNKERLTRIEEALTYIKKTSEESNDILKKHILRP